MMGHPSKGYVPTAALLSIKYHDNALYACMLAHTHTDSKYPVRGCEADRGYLLWGLTGVQRGGGQGDKDIVALPIVGSQAKLPNDHLALLDMQRHLHQASQLEPANTLLHTLPLYQLTSHYL